MKMAIKFSEFTPVPVAYESGAALPDKDNADKLCKRINDLCASPRWRVEEKQWGGKPYWMIVADS